jgi:hypothetical protein
MARVRQPCAGPAAEGLSLVNIAEKLPLETNGRQQLDAAYFHLKSSQGCSYSTTNTACIDD